MSKSTYIQVRVTQEVKDELTEKAKKLGFSSLSEYMLFVAKNAEIKVTAKKK